MERLFPHSHFIIYWKVKGLLKWHDGWDIHVGDYHSIWYATLVFEADFRCITTMNNDHLMTSMEVAFACMGSTDGIGLKHVR
jgi:hypothetical protein